MLELEFFSMILSVAKEEPKILIKSSYSTTERRFKFNKILVFLLQNVFEKFFSLYINKDPVSL